MNPPEGIISSVDIGERCETAMQYLASHMLAESGYGPERIDNMPEAEQTLLLHEVSSTAWQLMAITMYNLLQGLGKTNDFPNLGDWVLTTILESINSVDNLIPDTVDDILNLGKED